MKLCELAYYLILTNETTAIVKLGAVSASEQMAARGCIYDRVNISSLLRDSKLETKKNIDRSEN